MNNGGALPVDASVRVTHRVATQVVEFIKSSLSMISKLSAALVESHQTILDMKIQAREVDVIEQWLNRQMMCATLLCSQSCR